MKQFSRTKGWRLVGMLVALVLSLTACSQDYAMMYQKAINLFGNGEYAEAAQAFDNLGDYAQAPVYAAYAHGLVLFEQGLYTEATPYFEKSKGFMKATTRYAYCLAYNMEQSGAFAEAAAGFLALADFEDAAIHARYCQGRAAQEASDYETAIFAYEDARLYGDAYTRLEALQGQIYMQAIQLKEEKQYDNAISLFSMLGDFLSSAEQATECKQFLRDDIYDQAERLEAEGQLREAYDVFQGLVGHRDAGDRARLLGERLGIPVEETE